ncbi:hypothetical protein SOVF_166950 [Spinacia oleracea]|nr:hypothetical protein SOVF_166950 [Spinacia oleracea]
MVVVMEKNSGGEAEKRRSSCKFWRWREDYKAGNLGRSDGFSGFVMTDERSKVATLS